MSGRVVCINPPGLPGTTANREGAGGMGNVYAEAGAFLYPPHMLATAAGALLQDGLEVAMRDSVLEGDSVGEAVAWVKAQAPTWVAVQVSWATQDADMAFLQALRQALPGVALVAVGASVPVMEDAVDRLGGVGWLWGEPERLLGLAIAALGADASRWQGPLKTSTLQAAGFADDGRLLTLEGLPQPAWELLPWSRYGMLTVSASKGCEHGCVYCPYVIAQGRLFRPRPVSEVVDEMAFLAGKFAPARIIFRDPVFAHDLGRIVTLCKEIERRGLRVAWECESRADDFDPDLVSVMARAGCTTVKMGLESADTNVLVAAGRVKDTAGAAVYLKRAEMAALACRRYGVACRIFALTGLPEESEASLEQTAQFVTALQAGAFHVKEVTWYPGTALPRPDEVQAAVARARARALRDKWRPPERPRAFRLATRLRRLFR